MIGIGDSNRSKIMAINGQEILFKNSYMDPLVVEASFVNAFKWAQGSSTQYLEIGLEIRKIIEFESSNVYFYCFSRGWNEEADSLAKGVLQKVFNGGKCNCLLR